MSKKITIQDVREYQEKMKEVKANGCKVIDYKKLGRELQEKFNLTVPEVTAILNNKSDEILNIIE